jgi:Tol biopolymer transport system component
MATRSLLAVFLLASAVACASDASQDASSKPCSPNAAIQMVYGDFHRADQESGWVMALDDSGEPFRLVKGDDYAYTPQFSPDGSQVVFISARNGIPEASKGLDIYLIDADGKNERLVTERVEAFTPSWSPDGEWILFAGHTYRNKSGIFKVRPDGSGLEMIVELRKQALAYTPVWSPDGRHIAWAQWNMAGRDEPNQIMMATGDGSDVSPIAELSGVETIDWAPDGNTLATSSIHPEDVVYLVDVESGDVEELRKDGFGGRWNDDGSELVYGINPEEQDQAIVSRDMASGEESPLPFDGDVGLGSGSWFSLDPLPCSR